jgi:hypothetical protein
MAGQASITAEEREVRIQISARHEAGHAVGAAVLGLRLRPEGMAVDENGDGLTCFYKQPDGTDASIERIIVAAYAGFFAQKRFCEQRSYDLPDQMAVILSPDSKEARGLEGGFSWEYLGDRGMGQVDKALQERAAGLVEKYWPVIEALAQALLAKDWEPLKSLQSGSKWSSADNAKYISGEELVTELKRFDVEAVCVEEG